MRARVRGFGTSGSQLIAAAMAHTRGGYRQRPRLRRALTLIALAILCLLVGLARAVDDAASRHADLDPAQAPGEDGVGSGEAEGESLAQSPAESDADIFNENEGMRWPWSSLESERPVGAIYVQGEPLAR